MCSKIFYQCFSSYTYYLVPSRAKHRSKSVGIRDVEERRHHEPRLSNIAHHKTFAKNNH